MTDLNSEFFAFSKEVTKNFLHSAIIIDEEAHLGHDTATQTEPILSENIINPDKSDVIISHSNLESAETKILKSVTHRLLAKPIIDGFAVNGILCSVLKPEEKELPLNEILTKLAESADIIVFDWSLFNDQGKSSREMIKELTLTNPQGQLRLISIYTAEPDLHKILDQVFADLASSEKDINAEIQKYEAELEIKAGSAKIIVIAKPETDLLPQMKNKIVSFEILPDYLISEFTKMTSGLISNVALKAFTEIRRNSHRIISKFDSSLDAPYLTHRSMLSNTVEAEDQVTALIESEIIGILNEAKIGETAGMNAIKYWLNAKSFDSVDFGQKMGLSQRTPKLTKEEMEYLLKTGIQNDQFQLTGLTNEQKRKLKENPHKYPITKMFCDPTVENDCALNERFAFLTTMQSYYNNTIPVLTLGTVISEETGKSDIPLIYWICVQPRCDSVRLEKTTPFPFLPLKEVIPDGKFDVLIRKDQTNYKRLKIQNKPKNINIISFMPQSRNQQVVSQHIDGKQGYYFEIKEDTNKGPSIKYYKWEGEFRVQHAQRLANNFSNTISRVGLDESEWFRFWAKEE